MEDERDEYKYQQNDKYGNKRKISNYTCTNNQQVGLIYLGVSIDRENNVKLVKE